MKFNHIGIPTTDRFEGELDLPHLRITVSDHTNNLFGIQWQRYWDDAPEMGAPRRGMSTMQAFEVGLAAEKKAYDFYDMALPGITDPDVRTLFTELRDEETEHVEMLQEAMAKLPSAASSEVEFDLDETPYL